MKILCHRCEALTTITHSVEKCKELRELRVLCSVCEAKVLWFLQFGHEVCRPKVDLKTVADEILAQLSLEDRQELFRKHRFSGQPAQLSA